MKLLFNVPKAFSHLLLGCGSITHFSARCLFLNSFQIILTPFKRSQISAVKPTNWSEIVQRFIHTFFSIKRMKVVKVDQNNTIGVSKWLKRGNINSCSVKTCKQLSHVLHLPCLKSVCMYVCSYCVTVIYFVRSHLPLEKVTTVRGSRVFIYQMRSLTFFNMAQATSLTNCYNKKVAKFHLLINLQVV